MDKYSTNKIFTPSSVAMDSFVEREPNINGQLVDALYTTGKQIILYGYSGCGKSTLIINKLNQVYENYIISRCMRGNTFDSLLLDAFDQLGKYINPEGKKGSKKFTINPKITLEYNEIKGSVSAFEYTTQKDEGKSGIIPPQLTANRLGKYFGETKCCWILEDFHKLVGDEKVKASQLMKIFMDLSIDYPELKIVAIGAVGTAREVVQYDHEMNNRISEILVPPMTSEEIESIIISGAKLLNLSFTPKQRRKIAEYSCGLPAICHQICLNMCLINGIKETSEKLRPFTDEDLEEALEKLIYDRSDSFKADYDRAIKTNNGAQNIYKDVLFCALKTGKNEFKGENVFDELREKYSESEVNNALLDLSKIDRSEVLIYDENANTFRFNNLFSKNYILMNLSMADKTQSLTILKEKEKIDEFLELIEKDLREEYDDIVDLE